MRIAITVHRESRRVSPLFEASEMAVIVDRCRGVISSQNEVALPVLPEDKIKLLSSLGVQILLCGAIANETASLVAQHGLRLHSFAAGEWGEVLAGWRPGRHLQECHLMPGCGRRRQQRCQNKGRSWRQK